MCKNVKTFWGEQKRPHKDLLLQASLFVKMALHSYIKLNVSIHAKLGDHMLYGLAVQLTIYLQNGSKIRFYFLL